MIFRRLFTCVIAPILARDRLALSHRRWPSGKPRSLALCRSAAPVRFMALAIFLTGDLLRECALSSRTSSSDQGWRLVRRARLVAIKSLAARGAGAADCAVCTPGMYLHGDNLARMERWEGRDNYSCAQRPLTR
jgi:hypothetical protein